MGQEESTPAVPGMEISRLILLFFFILKKQEHYQVIGVILFEICRWNVEQ